MPQLRRFGSIVSTALFLAGLGCAASNGGGGAAGAGGSGQSGGSTGTGAGGTGAGGTGTGGSGAGGSAPSPWAQFAAKALKVSGNKLVDTTMATVRLLGVNRAGSEYRCSTGTANTEFDGPTGPNTITAMQAWHINAVRLPLNEQCWLGINGLPLGSVTPDSYQQAIQDYAYSLHVAGMYVILDLHWTGNGTTQATKQTTMADADHAVAFWTSVASVFKDDPMAIFDLYNEPILDDGNNNPASGDPWTCWLQGCTTQQGWQAAGMQQMLNAVRGAGANQVVVANGLNWASKLDSWLAHKPNDPAGNLVAGFHVYMNFGGRTTSCHDTTCWNGVPSTVAGNVPILIGEFGEGACQSTNSAGLMTWADSKSLSYLAWTFNPVVNASDCANLPALVTDWNGTPSGYGTGVKAHLVQVNP